MRRHGLARLFGREPVTDRPTVCECDDPQLVPIGGAWGAWHVCALCGRPPSAEVRR